MKVLTESKVIGDPPISRFLFSDTRMAIVWLAVRLYVGYSWIDAASHKMSDPAWVNTGEALKKYWLGAVAIPAAPARPLITFDWYRGFLQALLDSGSQVWFGKLVAYGELVVGIALILGAFVGIAAVAGAFMNLNFMLAGSASTNPILLLLAILLILAWKTAGFLGADAVLLNMLGTPWKTPRAERVLQPVHATT